MSTFRKLSIVMLVVFVSVFTMGIQHPANKIQAQGETLTIWHAWSDAEAELMETWITNFTEANPDVTVEARFVPFDDLRSTFENAGTEGPDLLVGQADWAGGLADAGLITPIDELIADTDLDAQVTEAAWGTMSYGGERYGTPITLDGVSLYYNRDLIADEDVPTTIEDLFAVGAELTDGEDVGLLFNAGFYHSAGIYFALGGGLFDEEGNNLWNTDDAAATYLAAHQQIFTETPELINGDNAAFQEGRAAMIVDGVWNLNTFTEKLGDSLGVALLPEINGVPWSPFVGGKGFYVNSQSENLDAAVAFLTYVTSAEGLALGAEIAGHVPTGEGVEVDNENIAMFAAQFALGTPLPTDPEMGAYWDPVGAAITAVTEGAADPVEAAAEAQALIEEKLGGEDTEGETTGDMPANIIEAATAAGNFTALLTAVEAAGLTEMLMGEGPYTVFAPSDEVFAALPPGTLEAVLADPDMLMDILQNHVVEGEILAADLAGMTTLTTVAGHEITVTVGEDGVVLLNGDTAVVVTDIMTGNGVIHVIAGVLVP